MQHLTINGRRVGPGEPPYVIAEIGSNHNGDMALCRRLIDAARDAGADAVKFQSWSKGSLVGAREFERNTAYADKKRHFGSLEEMVEKYQLTEAQHVEIVQYCQKAGITFMSSAFAPAEVDMLGRVGVDCYKLASMDINHLPLLRHIGATGKAVILSTGMSSLGEIERAIQTLREAGSGPVAILHCISIYPPAYETIHLRNIPMLEQVFDVPVGFSDHSVGTAVPLAAIALGACIIEKHFTLDKDLEGWDHWISATPEEMEVLCREGRNVFTALGSSSRTISDAEMQKRRAFRRRVVAKRAMKAGETIGEGDLDFKRPGTGINPDEAHYVIGRTVTRDLAPDDELEWADLR